MKTPQELFQVLKKEHAQADGLCKEVQFFRAEVGIPAINELRYAGHHLLLSLNEAGQVADAEQLIKAINHCRRASYEAVEAGLLSALAKIQIFKMDYSTTPITPVLAEWPKVLSEAEHAKGDLTRARSEAEDGKAEDYERHLTNFRVLKERCGQLDNARDEINKSIDRDRRDGRRFMIGAGLGLAAIATAIIIAIAAQ